MEGGGLIVGIKSTRIIPEKCICSSLDTCRGCAPIPDAGVVIQGLGQSDGIIEDVVENCVGFNVLFLLVSDT